MKAFLRGLAPFLLLPGCYVLAQSPGSGSSATSRVVIEAVVTGKDGFARNLTPEDFRVSVDGKDCPVISAALQASAGSAQSRAKHYMILLFDSGSVTAETQAEIRNYVTPFLGAATSPDRYVAILKWFTGLEIVQPFTVNAAALTKAMEKITAGAVLGQTGATPMSPTVAPASGASDDSMMRVQNLARSLTALAESLAAIRGRKDILYFSGGHPFPQETSEAVDAMMDAFNRANVAVHGISSNSSWAQAHAEKTGGTVIKFSNSLTQALNKLTEEQDAYYDVAFSLAAGLKAGCHEVKLKTASGNFDVRSRRRYCDPRSSDPLAGTPAGKDLEARAAGSKSGNMNASMHLPFFYSSADQARVTVALEIDTQRIKFQKRRGRMEADFNIVVTAAGEGVQGPRFSDAFTLSLEKQENVNAFQKTPFHYENQFQAQAGKYTVRVAFSSGDAFGKLEAPLVIERRDPNQVGLSAVTFGKVRRDRSGGMTAGLDPSVLEGLAPLMIRGVQIAPMGTTQIPISESAVIYAEVCAPAGAAQAPQFQFRFLDRVSGSVRFGTDLASASPNAPLGSQSLPVAIDAPLKQLGPGKYRVEVRAVAGASSTIRGLDFDVN